MTRMAAVMELQSAERRKSQDTSGDQGREAPPHGDMLMERILGRMNATPQEEVLRQIAFVPDIRRGKVLRIRRQVADGTYAVAERLDEAIRRVLEAITA